MKKWRTAALAWLIGCLFLLGWAGGGHALYVVFIIILILCGLIGTAAALMVVGIWAMDAWKR